MTTPDVPDLILGAADALEDALLSVRSMHNQPVTARAFQVQRSAALGHIATASRMLEALAPPLDTEPYAAVVRARIRDSDA